MDQTTSEVISVLLIGGTIVYLLILLVLAQIKYSDFIQYIKKIDPEYKENLDGLWVTEKGGGWLNSDYVFRSPLPISIKTEDNQLNELVKTHNKTIKLFWISALIITPCVVIILHLIN